MQATLPAAAAVDEFEMVMHAVDGDGVSLCGKVPADGLLHDNDFDWGMVPDKLRCHLCRILLASFGVVDR